MSSIKYFIKGTLKGSKCYDTYTDTLFDYELPEWIDEINSLFTKDKFDELAQYIHNDRKIYGVVTEIWVGVKLIGNRLFSWTEVTANRELTDDEKKELLDYLSGQFSDGYGEGLEQTEFYSGTEYEECEEYDEDADEYYTDEYEVSVDYHLHLWQRKDFRLEFVEIDTRSLNYAVEEGYITSEEFNIAAEIDFNINGEDYGLFLGQIKHFFKLEEIKSVSYFNLERTDYDGAYEVTLKSDGRRLVFGWRDYEYGLKEIRGAIKPKCKLIGADGNIFNLIGLAARTLRKSKLYDEAEEMRDRVMKSHSYSDALAVIMEYVEVE